MGSIKTNVARTATTGQGWHIAVVTHRFEASTNRYFQAFSTIRKERPSQNQGRKRTLTRGGIDGSLVGPWNSSNLDGARLVPSSMEE